MDPILKVRRSQSSSNSSDKTRMSARSSGVDARDRELPAVVGLKPAVPSLATWTVSSDNYRPLFSRRSILNPAEALAPLREAVGSDVL